MFVRVRVYVSRLRGDVSVSKVRTMVDVSKLRGDVAVSKDGCGKKPKDPEKKIFFDTPTPF